MPRSLVITNSPAMMDPIIIAFDLEFTGDSMTRNAVIEIGLAMITYKEGYTFQRNRWKIKKETGTVWEQKCLDEFWLNPERPEHKELKARYEEVERGEGTEVEVAIKEMVQVLREVEKLSGKDRIFFVTDTTSSDCSRLNYLLDRFGYPPLHTFYGPYKDVISTTSYARGACRVSYDDVMKKIKEKGYFSASKWCEEVCGVEKPDVAHNHDSRNDSLFIAKEHRAHAMKFTMP